MYFLISSFLTFTILAVLISSKKLPPCDRDELYKIEYHHKVNDDVYVKLNTTLSCICNVKYKVPKPKNYTQDGKNPEKYFLKIKCSKDNSKELLNKSICKPDEECQHDIWEEYGEENPGKRYKDYSLPLCKCDGSRRCMIERELFTRTTYTCKTLYQEPQINFCGKNSVAKVEYFGIQKKSRNHQDKLKKMDTLFLCRCVIFHSHTALEAIEDPKNQSNVIVEYKCPNKFYFDYDSLKSCSTGDLCGTDHFKKYGSNRPDVKYLDYTSKKCLCDRFRECVFKERIIEGNRNYYCELKKTNLQKLPICGHGDVYKEEVLLGIFNASVPENLIKMDTQFRCQCDSEKMQSSLLGEKSYPERNTLFRKYECIEKRIIKVKYCLGHQTCIGKDDSEKKMGDCLEHQVCKRAFIYDYGKDREEEQYVDTVEKFCNCHNGLECKPGSTVSLQSSNVTYDGVITYRCLKTEKEKLKPCVKNQTYMVQFHRIVNDDSTKAIKLNTFMKCNCFSKPRSMPGKSEIRYESLYPYVESITTYSCPRTPLPSARSRFCHDYGICQKSFKNDTGLEDPGKFITQYYTTLCKCRPELSCENVGEEDNATIFRCIKKKSSSKMEVCKEEGEVFQVNIDNHWYEKDVEPNDGLLLLKTKRANTFQVCICLEKNLHTNVRVDFLGDGPYWDAVEDKNGQLIRRFACIKRKNQKPEVTLPYCKHRQICKTQYFENAGTEKPGTIIGVNNFTESCICRDPGACQVTDRSSPYTVVSQCIVDNTKTPHLRRCIPGQVYMEEIHHNISTGNGGFRVIKNHTIHKCICEQALYNTELTGNMTISNHSADGQNWIHSYYCPRHVSAVEEVDSCIDYAVCRIDIFTHYGEDFGLDAKYLKNRLHYCACDRGRICNISEKDYPQGAPTTNDTYRCIKKKKGQELSPCKENQEFLVVVSRLGSNKSTVKLNTFLKCECDHDEDSYESFPNTSVIDPSVPDQLLRTYKCPLRIRPDENRYCSYNTAEVCLKVRHDHYGREKTGEYSFHSRKLCSCISPEVCIPYRRDDLITSYRCEPKKCEAGEVCRILEYSEYTANRALEKNETLCHCNGQCNYRSVASIVMSHAFQNATVYHSCKMPAI